MPHDKNGQILKVGDHVTIEAVITAIGSGEDYCNATARTVASMPPYAEGTSISMNTKQMELRVDAAPPASAAETE